ncbi:protein phosphatase 2C domain-containing protein [Demequina sp. B12]|uniref:PP2C family protein-serine/threonine phosphatase n=1 Tax=Demequina sp. B12 TaxID=2992757 RepID=UPI00237A87F0|nr:protein phosphatase 2C domain-containing protein [Demequina sp. B12]MDE0572059.1 protein phosphatase 2C domain-containing protein [Demequina sp. B12]
MTQAAPWSAGAGATDQGPRARNEDAFLSRGAVHIVADGMGGHHAGAAASAAVIDVFSELADLPTVSPEQVADAVVKSQAAVLEVSRSVGGESGTTVTGAIAVEHAGAPWWMVINVGDSRTYVIDGDVAYQVTRDHSHVQDLVDAGRITAAEAERHPDRNIVTRAIGDGLPDFDSWLVPVSPGARLVIASDGLTKVVDDRRIGLTAAYAGTPQEAASRLVDTALALTTNDNVTVVVADVLTAVTPPGVDVSPWTLFGEQWEDDDTVASSRRQVDR